MQKISRSVIAPSLCLIGALHTLIFTTFQVPRNFLLGVESYWVTASLKILLYTTAIATSFFHQTLSRTLGLRKSLSFGLWFNLFGLFVLLLRHGRPPEQFLLYDIASMLFFGMALTSVINSLITYMILEFPKKVGVALTALFAALNIGNLTSPPLTEFFTLHATHWWIYPFLMFFVLIALFFISHFFFEPRYPPHLHHLRKGGLVWRELHYRLVLFLLAIIGYGLIETILGLSGFASLVELYSFPVASRAISTFWLAVIGGQLLILPLLYYYRSTKIFYGLVLLLITALLLFPHEGTLPQKIGSLLLAGFGCSAIFPILLSRLEEELLYLVEKGEALPYIETGSATLVAGYLMGVGLIDLSSGLSIPLPSYFRLALFSVFGIGMIALYLNLTLPKRIARRRRR